MKKLNLLNVVALFFIFSSSAYAKNQCEGLFNTTTESATEMPHYLKIEKNSQLESKSVLNLTTGDFDKDPKTSAIEIIRRAMLSPNYAVMEKNFLNKDKLTLGVSITPEHILEIIYSAESRLEDQFIIEQINLRTITGYKLKIAENILNEESFDLKASQFEIAKYLPPGYSINLRAPLAIRGATLSHLANYAKSLDLFSKEELRKLFNEKTPRQISNAIFFRKAKELFVKVLIKEPFKIAIGGAMMFTLFNADRAIEMLPTHLVSKPAIVQQTKLESVQFEQTVKNADGKEVKLKVTARETSQSERIDYSLTATSK